MNIKYTGNGPDKGKVHINYGNGKTACGKTYSDNPEDWENTNELVTCENCKK